MAAAHVEARPIDSGGKLRWFSATQSMSGTSEATKAGGVRPIEDAASASNASTSSRRVPAAKIASTCQGPPGALSNELSDCATGSSASP